DRVVTAALLTYVADPLSYLLRPFEQVTSGHGRFAATWWQQSRQHPEGGCLAGAIGSEKAEDGSGFDMEVDSGHGLHGVLPGLEGPGQAAGLDHAIGLHGHSPFTVRGGPTERWLLRLVPTLSESALA